MSAASRVARAAGLALALVLAACVTDGEEGTMSETDLGEAARINTQLGLDYMRRGQMEEAREKLEKAVEQDPDFAPAHSSLAIVYVQLGKTSDAKRHYRKALSLDSEDPVVKNNFGTFLCAQGEVEDAEEYFLEAANNPRYTTREAAWTNAGVCLRRVPDLTRSEKYFREALKINPQFPDALLQMALLSYETKDFLRARAFVQRYERVAKPTPELLWIAAQTERQLGDSFTASRYEHRLRRDFPDSDQSYQIEQKKPGAK